MIYDTIDYEVRAIWSLISICWTSYVDLILKVMLFFDSVQFSRSVMSNSLRLHGLQHTMSPSPSPTPGVYSNSCPSSWRCHPAISSSVVPFFSCPQSLPASESFLMSQLFSQGGQITGVSALASFRPKKSQGWSPSEWTGCISLQSLVANIYCILTVFLEL